MDEQIRLAAPDDEPALARLDRVTWSGDVTPAPPPEPDAPFFEEGRTTQDVLVAEHDGEVVGYVQMGAGYPIPTHEHVAFLRGLAVDSSCHGRGIGRRLVSAALDELRSRGAERVRSRVLSTNPASLAVHRAAGFVVEGTLRGEFRIEGRTVDDVLLARDL